MLEVAEADLEPGFVRPQACRKSVAERVDANDRAFRTSRWRRGSVARARCTELTLRPAHDRRARRAEAPAHGLDPRRISFRRLREIGAITNEKHPEIVAEMDRLKALHDAANRQLPLV
jgi:hypothetical protein